mmetsp:Transcript_18171/g.51992  ORF Transcript_18171/g.51992 Transcript_18171/m.51992 type:complete len:206 (-) Transcript_18171:138-755(-)
MDTLVSQIDHWSAKNGVSIYIFIFITVSEFGFDGVTLFLCLFFLLPLHLLLGLFGLQFILPSLHLPSPSGRLRLGQRNFVLDPLLGRLLRLLFNLRPLPGPLGLAGRRLLGLCFGHRLTNALCGLGLGTALVDSIELVQNLVTLHVGERCCQGRHRPKAEGGKVRRGARQDGGFAIFVGLRRGGALETCWMCCGGTSWILSGAAI